MNDDEASLSSAFRGSPCLCARPVSLQPSRCLPPFYSLTHPSLMHGQMVLAAHRAALSHLIGTYMTAPCLSLSLLSDEAQAQVQGFRRRMGQKMKLARARTVKSSIASPRSERANAHAPAEKGQGQSRMAVFKKRYSSQLRDSAAHFFVSSSSEQPAATSLHCNDTRLAKDDCPLHPHIHAPLRGGVCLSRSVSCFSLPLSLCYLCG